MPPYSSIICNLLTASDFTTDFPTNYYTTNCTTSFVAATPINTFYSPYTLYQWTNDRSVSPQIYIHLYHCFQLILINQNIKNMPILQKLSVK